MEYGSTLGALLLVPAVACAFQHQDSSARVTVRVGDSVTLAVGQTAVVGDAGLRITFVSVVSDSRCPTDVTCVTAGDAKVRLRASSAGMNPAEADVGLLDRTTLAYAGVEFKVERLDPWPTRADGAPSRSAYRATLRTRAATSG